MSASGSTRPRGKQVTLGEKAVIAVLRMANKITVDVTALLKPHGLTLNQYNALRILRGAGDGGATCGQVSERMLTRDPDVTRLIDRLERAGLAARSRDDADRRVVTTRITPVGLALLGELDAQIMKFDRALFRRLDDEELKNVVNGLEAAIEE